MTAGMAFEALNHAGIENSNLLVILNDNCMSIDPAVGALKEYLTDISTSKTYNKAKNKIWRILGKISKFGPNAQKVAQKVEGAVKSTLLGESNYFESLNFRYFGPIDGHDVKHLSTVLKDLKSIPGPKILHCLTKKGKGYNPAEEVVQQNGMLQAYLIKTQEKSLKTLKRKIQPQNTKMCLGKVL